MKYIFITYKAILQFASDRFLQSYENDASNVLCDILRIDNTNWIHPSINLYQTDKGIVFFTKDSDYKKALVFDLNTFGAFNKENDNRTIINIFQKTIKYAVRYFEGLPPASCERILPDSSITLIYPNPFVATHDVLKVCVDRNSSKINKKECNYLTVYDYSTDSKIKVSFTSLNKAYEDVRNLNFIELSAINHKETNLGIRFSSTELEYKDLKLDTHIGFENWLTHYLTDVQKSFVTSDFVGPERLEGAAGTGKTLCLILRCIYLLKKHINLNDEYHIIFFTHTISTKEKIVDIFKTNWEDYELCEENNDFSRPRQSILVTTLQEWSGNHLGTNSISDNEYLDKDAAYSKEIQMYYIDEAYKNIKANFWQTLKVVCSDKFQSFLEYTPEEHLIDLFRQEIAVLIKGRAGGEYDVYRAIPRPTYSLPLINDADYKFVFYVFNSYQDALMKVGQYDSDDITLTALAQMRTPIWNRRRIKEGYDACVIDETHLFNINELSVFHYVNKPDSFISYNFIYAIDKSQSTGDWGLDDLSINTTFGIKNSEDKIFNTVFRCSPDIVNLAYNILSSGANLFTHFDNPLLNTSFDFVREEEMKTIPPEYDLVEDDQKAIERGIEWAEKYCNDKRSLKSSVLIIGTANSLVSDIQKYLRKTNKPYEILQSRNDINAIKKAESGNKFIVSSIEYVGGLEFDAVVIIGVDDGRVPPTRSDSGQAYHVLNYAWHSKMYVAVTRAKFAVKILGEISRGPCELLYSSIINQSVVYTGPKIE